MWINESVVIPSYDLEDKGIEEYQDFAKNVLEDCAQPIHDPIKNNSIALVKRPQPKATFMAGKKDQSASKQHMHIALFGKLYISMQGRDGDQENSCWRQNATY